MILNHVRLIRELSSGISTESGFVRVEKDMITEVSDRPYPLADETAVNTNIGNTEDIDMVDCKGKTLIPGLSDLHTHITVLNQVGFNCLHSDMELLTTAA